MLLSQYWPEFIAVATVHLLAVASPGPDFAVVVRQSLSFGRKEAIWTSVGVGIGILIHVTYSLLGLGLLISQSVLAFNILKVLAVGYLLYVSWQCINAKPQSLNFSNDTQHVNSRLLSTQSIRACFRLGFLTNALNPKATLFFVALFSVVISPETPVSIQLIYGLWMAFATGLWFIGLSLFFSHRNVRSVFSRFGHWVERLMGGALLLLAGKLAFATMDGVNDK
jgi:RhtB (resistance to homoserine/threonine) family protein